jgi:TPP-dependent indolepyruvate ferredoxin oxidoreductase alpha subunit
MQKSISSIISQALYDAGIRVLTCVPGSGGNAIFDNFNKISNLNFPVSFNEEPAYSIAHGAAVCGTPSAALMKAHGLLKAANSVSDSLYCGTTAGMLTIVLTDKDGHSSDSVLDIEPVVSGIGLPYEIADINDIYRQIHHLLAESEKWSLPYALLIDSSQINLPIAAAERQITSCPQQYNRIITQHVLCPFFGSYQRSVLDLKKNRKEWASIPPPQTPQIPEAVPDIWKAPMKRYSLLFDEFKKMRGSMVTGDIGISSLFACEPYNCIDITTYLGGSIPLALGAYLAGYHDAWAVSGDFAFIAAGQMGLLEALQRKIPVKILLLNNGISATTGGQQIPENMLETVLCGYKKYLRYIRNPQDREEVAAVLEQARQSEEMTIVIADYRD